MSNNTQFGQNQKNLRILVVDDDDFQLEFTSDLLNDIGIFDVATATGGADALAQVKHAAQKPDVVICDLYMPVMDGFEFMSALAKLNYSGAIIIVSGQEKRVIHSASLVAQLSAFNYLGELQKPINSIQLKTLIGKLK